MKYSVQGQGTVELSDITDFKAKGGEGKIYAKGNLVYKIYNNPSKLIPEAKIKELQCIDADNVLMPLNIILEYGTGKPVGFTMKWVKNTVVVCQLFPTEFLDEKRIDNSNTIKLVENLKKTTIKIHKKDCLIVDYNELNFLVDNKEYIYPYFIDTNSYQTPNFKATALMPSIKDWHSKTFTELSDWFSFAVVSFQLFTGIHPFRGTHPNYSKKEMSKRMQHNVSVYNPEVLFPPTVRDFSHIPSRYDKWFRELFQEGKRSLPPDMPGTVTVRPIKIETIQGDNVLDIKFVKEYDDTILKYRAVYSKEIVTTKKSIFINNIKYKTSDTVGISFTPRKLIPILSKLENNELKLKSLQSAEIDNSKIDCVSKTTVGDSLFIVNSLGELIEIEFNDMLEKVFLKTTNLADKPSAIFDGIAYREALGNPFLFIPLTRGECIVKKIPELDGYKIINGKHRSKVCIIIGHKDGKYDRLVFKFDDNYNHYDCRITEDVENYINFTVSANGVVVSIVEDGMLEVFLNNLAKNTLKEIKSNVIKTNMRLFHDGVQIMFSQNNRLYKMSMRK